MPLAIWKIVCCNNQFLNYCESQYPNMFYAEDPQPTGMIP